MRTHTLCALAATAALLALAACGGSNSAVDSKDPPAGQTETEAQKDQKKALMDALAQVDTSDLSDADKIAAAKAAIAELQEAYDDATDVSPADKAMYKTSLDNANKAVRKQEQTNALLKASEALDTALTAVTGVTPTTDQLTTAVNAIKDLRAKLNEAKDLTEEEKAEYQQELTRAEGRDLEDKRAAAIAKGITDGAIMDAGNAVGMVTDTSDPSTETDAQEKIAAAEAAITAADIPEAEKAKLRTALAVHKGALEGKKASRETAMAVTGIRDGEIKAAMTAVGMLERASSRETWADAEAKLAAAGKAIDDASISPEKKTELRTELAQHQTTFNTAAMARKAYAEAQFSALGGPNTPDLGAGPTGTQNAMNNLENAAEYTFIKSATDKVVGLKLDPRADGGSLPDTSKSGPNFPVVLTEVEAAGEVGDWTVTRRSNGRRNTTGEKPKDLNDKETLFDRALFYRLDRTPTVKAAVHFESDDKPLFAGDHKPAERVLTLGTGVDRHIAAPGFPKAGIANDLTLDDSEVSSDASSEILIRGTYQGAPTYRCTYDSADEEGCRVSVGNYGQYFLAANWSFKYDEDAEVVFEGQDTSFAYFGWWVRENKGDGMPRVISSFVGTQGGGIGASSDVTGMSGTATYEGPAAGQYAIHDPLNGESEAGEFTATAALNAKFGNSSNTVDVGLTGTIDRFRLNGGSGDPDWSVALKRTGWATGGQKIIGADGRTTWTIDGVPGSEVKGWEAELFDTTLAESRGGSDGSDIPDLVLGRFYSEHGRTHRLVGAFGASVTSK